MTAAGVYAASISVGLSPEIFTSQYFESWGSHL
jgi:hypothetical protein